MRRWRSIGAGTSTGPTPTIIWLAGFALEAGVGTLLIAFAGRHGPALLAVLINLAIAARFAATLAPGRVPLITRYARLDEAGLPRECEGYTRALTLLWAVLLAVLALGHSGALLDLWTTRQMSWVQAVISTAVFLGEHPLRNRLVPAGGRATPLRTFRAIWRGMSGSAAGSEPVAVPPGAAPVCVPATGRGHVGTAAAR